MAGRHTSWRLTRHKEVKQAWPIQFYFLCQASLTTTINIIKSFPPLSCIVYPVSCIKEVVAGRHTSWRFTRHKKVKQAWPLQKHWQDRPDKKVGTRRNRRKRSNKSFFVILSPPYFLADKVMGPKEKNNVILNLFQNLTYCQKCACKLSSEGIFLNLWFKIWNSFGIWSPSRVPINRD